MRTSLIAALGALALVGTPLLASAQLAQPAAPTPPIETPQDTPYPGTITLEVDASDMARSIFQVHEIIPVAQAGEVTLLYPEWIPGAHAPEGTLDKLAGLTISANGQRLPWRRDLVNAFAFHVDAPAGPLDVRFQYLSPTADNQGEVLTTPDMLMLQWHTVVLYPSGHFARRIMVEPHLTLPTEWKFASALDGAETSGATTRFAAVNLVDLIDSPVLAGRHFRRIDLDPGARLPMFLDITADKPEELAASDAQIRLFRNLVHQADALFGARHFNHFDFLFTLNDEIGYTGLEHHRSSQNGLNANYFTDFDGNMTRHFLLPHEFIHSWDGKFRRPADQWTPNYNTPMRDDLLWVYEGGTSYWGDLLTTRSGLWTKQQALDLLASSAAGYSHAVGRAWRPLQDTTADPVVQRRQPEPWGSWQRGEDYYGEGSLMWLDADTLIRERTHDRKSLDDFARLFFGGHNGEWQPLTYTFDDVVAALNSITPYDWANFLRTRLDAVNTPPPLDGIARGGYRLVYTEERSEIMRATETRTHSANFMFSLGLNIAGDGRVTGVLWDGPAFNEGLIIGSKILGVNGRAYDADALRDAISAARTDTHPIELWVQTGDRLRTIAFDYHEGLKYPHLERVPGTRDRLSEIYAPRR